MRWTPYTLFLVYVVGFFWYLEGCADSTIYDATGHQVVLWHPARRIISLAPNLSELLFLVGSGNQIIAKDENSDFPPVLRKLPTLYCAFHLNLEQIISLKPDLLVIEYSQNFHHDIEKLRQMHIPIYVNRATHLEGVAKTIIDLGKLSGHGKLAQQKATEWSQKLEAVKKYYGTRKKVAVFYELWDNPLLTVNKQTIIGDMITYCGGINVFADCAMTAPKINVESVIKRNPRLILSSFPTFKKYWAPYVELDAVKNHYLVYIPPEFIERTGPRLIMGLERVCAAIDQSRRP